MKILQKSGITILFVLALSTCFSSNSAGLGAVCNSVIFSEHTLTNGGVTTTIGNKIIDIYELNLFA